MPEDDWKTLRVPPEAYEQAKEQKEEHNRTWGEQLLCNNSSTMDRRELVADIRDQLESLDNPSTTSDNIVEIDTDEIVETLLQRLDEHLDEYNNNATTEAEVVVENVELGNSDIPDSVVTDKELDARIEGWVERNWSDLRSGM